MSPRRHVTLVTLVTALACGCATDAIPEPRDANVRAQLEGTAQSPGLAAQAQAPAKPIAYGGQGAPPPAPPPPAPASAAEAPPVCTPQCAGRACGPNGCGGWCGECPQDSWCNSAGRCEQMAIEPRCGNGRIDPDEDCDGGDGCTEDCRTKAVPSDSERCENLAVSEASDECMQCVCSRCTDRVLACYASGDQTRDQRCTAVAECGYRNDCHDSSCYCGASLFCRLPSGPCRAEIESAADLKNGGTLARCDADPECATYRARILGQCVVAECASVCRR